MAAINSIGVGYTAKALRPAQAASVTETRVAPDAQATDRAEAAKRAIIGSVFRIDASTDLSAMFGDIQFSERELAQTDAFIRGLESLRSTPTREPGAELLDRRV